MRKTKKKKKKKKKKEINILHLKILRFHLSIFHHAQIKIPEETIQSTLISLYHVFHSTQRVLAYPKRWLRSFPLVSSPSIFMCSHIF